MRNLLLLSFLPLLFSVTRSSPLYYRQPNDLQCDLPSTSARFDCHPDPNPDEGNCAARGCCWHSASKKVQGIRSNVGQGIPFCYYPANYNGYNMTGVKETQYGYQAVMTRANPSGWPDDVKTLTMDVWFESAKTLHFKVTHIHTDVIFAAYHARQLYRHSGRYC